MAVYRAEKKNNFTQISNNLFRDNRLSYKAQGVLCQMLSLPENWKYSAEGLSKLGRDGVDSVKSALTELEKAGYLVRKRHRLSNGRLGPFEYFIYEEPFSTNENTNSPETEKPQLVIPQMVSPFVEEQSKLKYKESNTKQSNEMIDVIERACEYCETIKENIGYDYLVNKYGADRVAEIVGIIVDTIISDDPLCRIERTDIARELVRSRYLKLDDTHIEYVFESMDNSSTKIHNVKHYIQTTLYNAPITKELSTRAELNFDDAKRLRCMAC